MAGLGDLASLMGIWDADHTGALVAEVVELAGAA